jgi:tetratricopeptide (TPR) repeat protein
MKTLTVSVVALFIAASPAFAQSSRPQIEPRTKQAEPRAKPAPRPNKPDRSRDLNFLFGALKAAPDAEAAKSVEVRITSLLANSGSDTTDLLMQRAKRALDAKDNNLSLELLDAVVDIRPEFAEGWNRRATLHFLNKNYVAAIADIRHVLAIEPRHFGAMVGFGMILHELDEDALALKVLRKALEVHPYLERIDELVKTLSEKVEGREI